MINNYKGIEDVESYNTVVQKLRNFFQKKGFIEVCVQDRLSILAACEDPTTSSNLQIRRASLATPTNWADVARV